MLFLEFGVTDSIILGWYSVEALAAGVLGHTACFVIFIVGGGFGIAVLPLVASDIARNATEEARRVTRMGVWLSIAYAMAVFAIIYFFRSPFGADPSIRRTCAIDKSLFGYRWLCPGSCAYYTGFEIISGCPRIGKICLSDDNTWVFCEYTA